MLLAKKRAMSACGLVETANGPGFMALGYQQFPGTERQRSSVPRHQLIKGIQARTAKIRQPDSALGFRVDRRAELPSAPLLP
jgi:hypothetical protein